MRSRPWGESWHEHFGRFSATMARFEKAALVSKLRHAPDAKQAVTDRCQGGSRCGSPQRKSSPGAHPKRAGNAVGAPSRPAGTLGPRGRAISRRQLSAVPLFFFGSGLESSYLRVATVSLACCTRSSAATPFNSRRELVWCGHTAHGADLA